MSRVFIVRDLKYSVFNNNNKKRYEASGATCTAHTEECNQWAASPRKPGRWAYETKTLSQRF